MSLPQWGGWGWFALCVALLATSYVIGKPFASLTSSSFSLVSLTHSVLDDDSSGVGPTSVMTAQHGTARHGHTFNSGGVAFPFPFPFPCSLFRRSGAVPMGFRCLVLIACPSLAAACTFLLKLLRLLLLLTYPAAYSFLSFCFPPFSFVFFLLPACLGLCVSLGTGLLR